MPSVRLHLLLALLLSGSATAQEEGAVARPLYQPDSSALPFSRAANFTFSPMGMYSTGLAFADINGDGFDDLVVSNGNDQGLQPLAVYQNNQRGRFTLRPTWLSEDIDSNMGLAVGDINGDGWIDVAVSVFGDRIGAGRVKVYLNRQGRLEGRPSFQSSDRFSSFACALGDADGDGRLDLAVSAFFEGSRSGGFQRIYFNRPNEAGEWQLQSEPGWLSTERVVAGGLTFSDINEDGFLDLVVGAAQARIYSGRMDNLGRVAIDREPSWKSMQGLDVGWVDVGPLGPEKKRGLVLARNARFCPRACPPARFEAYLPQQGTTPVWSSSEQQLWGSGVKLADINNDGLLDLLGGSWGQRLADGTVLNGQLQIFLGGTGFFASTPAFTSSSQTLVQAIDVRTLTAQPSRIGTLVLTSPRPQSVLTLPEQIVVRIKQVVREGRLLEASDYTSIPGASWLAFREPLRSGERLLIQYEHPRELDIANANQDCNVGNFIYYRFRSPSSLESPPGASHVDKLSCPHVGEPWSTQGLREESPGADAQAGLD